MKPGEIMGLITQQAAATKLNVKGFVGESGICFSTFRRLQMREGGQSMVSSVAAFLRLMDIAQVSHPERYVELDLPGEEVVVIRREDFLAMKAQRGVKIADHGKTNAVRGAANAAPKKNESGPGKTRAKTPRLRAKPARKGGRAIAKTGRCCSRGRSNKRGREEFAIAGDSVYGE